MNQNKDTSASNVNNNAVINIENNYTGGRNNDSSSSNISRLGGNSNILNVLDNDSGAITQKKKRNDYDSNTCINNNGNSIRLC